jgi:hypothetical protein
LYHLIRRPTEHGREISTAQWGVPQMIDLNIFQLGLEADLPEPPYVTVFYSSPMETG